MESKLSIFIVVALLAVAMFLPFSETDAVDSEMFSYKSQLDDNGLLVYNEVSKATTLNGLSREFIIAFSDSSLYGYDTEDKAKAYADSVVQNALSAAYLSNPMVPYLWDYPVKAVQVDASVSQVIVKSETGETTYYKVDKVAFTLTVPEGITSDSMKELEEAIKSYDFGSGSDADKVSQMIKALNKLKFKADEEGKISNIYNALVEKECTSAGVAQAFSRFCALNNIPSIIVAGDNLKANDEPKNFWNYVYLEGDHDGKTAYAWYVVDASYCADAGICGSRTTVDYDDGSYSISAILNVDLNLSGENDLTVPTLNSDKYVGPGGPSFLELHGEKLVLAALGVILVVGMLYAVRSGNF